MVNSNGELKVLADELTQVLDKDIAQVGVALERLDGLRHAVIRRDEEGLRSLLEQVTVEGESYDAVERRREAIRGRIAEILGIGREGTNLSAVCSALDAEQAKALGAKQAMLREVTEKLRREHMSTTLLLRECSRLNRLFLKGIFGAGKESVTYTPRGNKRWEVDNKMVNMRL